jgi:hypothetical protein
MIKKEVTDAVPERKRSTLASKMTRWKRVTREEAKKVKAVARGVEDT